MSSDSPFSQDRRSFVKKSLATSVSISFAGLIRAHGEEGGGTTTTTWSPDESTFTTTEVPPTTTWNPDLETTCAETYVTTAKRDSKKRRWKCKITVRGPRSHPYTQEELDEIHEDEFINYPELVNAPQGPPTGGRLLSGPVDEEYWDPARPDGGVQVEKRRENGPTMSNWVDPTTGENYAAYLYDYVEEEYEADPQTEP